jgi:hypothetical protein
VIILVVRVESRGWSLIGACAGFLAVNTRPPRLPSAIACTLKHENQTPPIAKYCQGQLFRPFVISIEAKFPCVEDF